jgi:hypothetical protein
VKGPSRSSNPEEVHTTILQMPTLLGIGKFYYLFVLKTKLCGIQDKQTKFDPGYGVFLPPGSWMEQCSDPGAGIKHPGSATLVWYTHRLHAHPDTAFSVYADPDPGLQMNVDLCGSGSLCYV